MREVFTEVVIAPSFTDGGARGVRRSGRTCAWCAAPMLAAARAGTCDRCPAAR